MNERIKELEKQAWEFVDKTWNWANANNPSQATLFKEKFAELIVKECMTVCADNACQCWGGLNTQVGEDLYLAADLIKEHFGVEE